MNTILTLNTNDHIALSVVIPMMNEEANLATLNDELNRVLQDMDISYEILYVDDGSLDDTFALIEALSKKDSRIRGISLSRNFGHQKALVAGLSNAKGDAVLSMDGDMQHPPYMIPELYEHFKNGIHVVNTQRLDTEDAGWLKRRTSKGFYKFINVLSHVEIVQGSADFRLVSRQALEQFLRLGEKDRFNRGLFSWLGFSQIFVPYHAPARLGGKSKYSLKKMISFALDGVTSFSSKPLRLSFFIGIFMFGISLLYAMYAIWQSFEGNTIAGWTSLLVTVIFIGGIQLMSIGLLGEYLARVFNETKQRPLYIIQKDTDNDQ